MSSWILLLILFVDEAVAATKPEKDKEDDMILDDGEDTLPTNKLKELNISQEIAESLEKEVKSTANPSSCRS